MYASSIGNSSQRFRRWTTVSEGRGSNSWGASTYGALRRPNSRTTVETLRRSNASAIETRDRTTGTPGFTTNAPGSVPGDAGYGSISGGSTIRGIEFRVRTSRTRPADEYLIVYDAAKLAQDIREKYELPASSESQL